MTDKALLTAEEREMAERCDVATDGPWEAVPGHEADDWGIRRKGERVGESIAQMLWSHDSKFAAYARTDIPALLETVTSLRAALAQAQAEREARWIAVTEREPRVGEWCWVVYAGHVQRMTAYLALVGSPDEVIAGKASKEWRWAIEEADPYPFEEITHWTPEPTPPRAGELEAARGPEPETK